MEKIIYERVGARLKQARELRHLTLKEVGKNIGVYAGSVLRWENGETEKIKLPILEALASYYNVNPEWLMGYDVPMEKEDENYNFNKLRSCAYTILDNAQAIMMECHNENPYPGYLLEKIKPIENDIKVIKSICMKGEN